MNIYVFVTLLLVLPAVSGQYSELSFCRLVNICRLIQNCLTSSSYCARLAERCRCNFQSQTTRAPTTRAPTTRRPPNPTQNGCGVGQMGNAQAFVDSLPRIVGGNDAPSGYFPWQVKVRPGSAHCGGTLVSRDTVVTAAHCVDAYEGSPRSVEIAFGSVDINNAQRVRASGVIIHPDYRSTSQPDLAIIKLSQPVTYSPNVQPACLPRQNQPVETNKLSIVTGWGILSETNSRIPNIMQYVAVPIVSQSECNRFYNGGIRDGEFCAGYIDGGRDACQGDSGGALVMSEPSGSRWELVGVVSRGIGCARRDYPGIYARVPRYVSWIQSNM